MRLMVVPAIFRLAWREATTYRFNFAMSFMVIALPFVLQVFLWSAVFRGREQLAGRSLSEMIVYYLLVLLVFDFVQPTVLFDVSDDIKSGTLALHLIRPLPYPVWSLVLRLGSQTIYLAIVATTVAAGVLLLGFLGVVNLGELLTARLASFAAVFLLAWLVGAVSSLAVSFVVFFTEDAAGVSKLVAFLFPLLSGSLIPLDLLPGWLKALSGYLPFRWLVYEPIRVFTGQQTPGAALLGLAAWGALTSAVAWLLWRSGKARFTAVGG